MPFRRGSDGRSDRAAPEHGSSGVPRALVARAPCAARRVLVRPLLGGLELVEQRVEELEVPLPELAVVLQPRGRLRERLRLEPTRPALPIPTARDQARALEHLEVLGD